MSIYIHLSQFLIKRNIQKIVRVFSLVLEELIELIGSFRGVHHRLIKRLSTTVCGVFIDLSSGFPLPFVASSYIPRFLFRIKQRVEVSYTKVLVFVVNNGSRVRQSNLIVERSWVPLVVGSRHSWRESHHLVSEHQASNRVYPILFCFNLLSFASSKLFFVDY